MTSTDVCRSLIERGYADIRSGTPLSEREAVFDEALRLAREIEDPQLFGEAALGRVARKVNFSPGSEHSVRLLREAISYGPPPPLRAELTACLALLLRRPDHDKEKETLSKVALTHARSCGQDRTLAATLIHRHDATWGPERTKDLLKLVREAKEIATAIGDCDLQMSARQRITVHALALGDLATVKRELRVVRNDAEYLGDPAYLWWQTSFRATLAIVQGDLERGAELSASAFNDHGGAWNDYDHEIFYAQMFTLQWFRGGLHDLEESIRSEAHRDHHPIYDSAYALLLTELGRIDDARHQLDIVASSGFDNIPRDQSWLVAMSILAEACAEAKVQRYAEYIYDLLRPYAGLQIVGTGIGGLALGAVDLALGRLALALDRWPDAEDHLLAALVANRRICAQPFVATSHCFLARLYATRADCPDWKKAKEHCDECCEISERIGLENLKSKIPNIEHSRVSTSVVVPDTPIQAAIFREGAHLVIDLPDRRISLKTLLGHRYLLELLANPDRDFLALDLIQRLNPRAAVRAQRIGDPNLLDGFGPALDDQAKAAYQNRIRDLEELEREATAQNDPEKASQAHAERETLISQLHKDFGLGERNRKRGSNLERARVSATKEIRFAIRKINSHSEFLGDELQRSIETGVYCRYSPGSAPRIVWHIKGTSSQR